MATAKEYRQRAKQCLQLAEAADELYAKQAMFELAQEFNKAAEKGEQHDTSGRVSAESGRVRGTG